MKIIIVGQGAREHALAWRLTHDGHDIIGAPGNPGIAEMGDALSVSLGDIPELAAACIAAKPDLVVVGPEAPLAAGLADVLLNANVPVFGPTKRAAQLETSKAFAKDIMQKAGVPTARWRSATTPEELNAALEELGGAVAVKADGLMAGKGVVVCSTVAEASTAGKQLLSRGPIVIEERLEGPELSVIAITDGKRVAILPPSRDHKRLGDGDSGPNTGGMGAVAPITVSNEFLLEIRDTVLRPTLAEMQKAHASFCGAIFAGLMLTKDGPRVLEFNARFGDPETQAILTALDENIDLGQLLLQAAQGELNDTILQADGFACGVVLAASGYPDNPRTGDAIEGIPEAISHGAHVFHAGTIRDGEVLVTNGGRVLSVVAKAPTMTEARARALHAARRVYFADAQFRTDIGATSE